MKPILTLILILSLHNCLAQNNWKPGFIVAAGDTMHGYIDARDSKSLSTECHFQSHPAAGKQVFGPAELDAFGFTGGKLFVSRIPDEMQKPVFLEFLLKGRISLFHIVDQNTNRYFAEKEGILYELKNSTQEIIETGQTRDRKEYIGMLNYLLASAGLRQEVNHSKLEVNSLVNLVYNYHQNVCPDEECLIYARQKRKASLKLGVVGGMYQNSFDFNPAVYSNRGNGNFWGVRLELQNGFDFMEKLNMVLDLTLIKFTNYTLTPRDNTFLILDDIRYHLYNGNAALTVPTLDVNIKTLALNVPMVFSWNFTLGGTFRPYAGVGLVSMFVLSQNKGFVFPRYHDRFGQTIPAFHIGPIARAGCKVAMGKSLVFLEANLQKTQNFDSGHRFLNQIFSVNAGVSF